MSIDRQLWSRSLQRPFFKASCWIQDQSRQKHKQTERYKDTPASSSGVEDPVVFLRWWYRYQRRPVPELIERHSAGHQRHQHGGAQAAGVVEGVLLQLPEPFIVVVLLSLFWMLLPLYVECRCCLKP